MAIKTKIGGAAKAIKTEFWKHPIKYTWAGAEPLAGIGGNIWGERLGRKDFRERRKITTDRYGKDKKYITETTGEEFAGRGTAGSTLHKRELERRLRPIETQEQLIAQQHKERRRSKLFNILFGG
jgi:hypothetical protein